MPLKKNPIRSVRPKKTKAVSNFNKKLEETPEQIDTKSFRDDIDSKKEFFRLMAEKIKEESSSENATEHMQEKRHAQNKVSYYKKILWRYLLLVMLLVIVVSYFSLSQLDLVVYTNKESINDNLNFYAYYNDSQPGLERSVKGEFSKINLELSDTFPSTGKKSTGGELVGKVKIINNYTKNQPLVATTRLLSPDNKLFRIKDTINVPAGGSIEVAVYSDVVSEEMAIAPTKFTIPGLWEGVQDKIYAESSEKFELKQDSKKFVTQNDIDTAISLLNEKMVKEAEAKTPKSSANIKNILNLDIDSVKVEVSKKVGDEVDTFDLSIKSVVNVISLNSSDVVSLIEEKLDILKSSQGAAQVDASSLSYSLINFNSAKSLVEIKVDFLAKNSFIGGSGIDKKHLTNLSEKQIKAYLNGVSGLKSYELFFRPSFIKRAPILSSRINISYK